MHLLILPIKLIALFRRSKFRLRSLALDSGISDVCQHLNIVQNVTSIYFCYLGTLDEKWLNAISANLRRLKRVCFDASHRVY